MFISNGNSTCDWKNYDLILPIVANGCIGQLSVDLFISKFEPQHVGHFHSPYVYQMVGSNPFKLSSSDIVTSIEVYEYQERKLVFLQQRSQVMANEEKDFVSSLVKWIKAHQFKRIIAISSGTAEYHPGQSFSLFYLCTSKANDIANELEIANWKKYFLGIEPHDGQDNNTIPNGGISNLFFNECEENDIPLLLTILVCWEGQNFDHGIYNANFIYKWLFKTNDVCQWKIPPSWNCY